MAESARRDAGRGARKQRSAARLAAVQALYQLDMAETTVSRVLDEFLLHRLVSGAVGAVDKVLFADLVQGASTRRDEIDRMLGSALVQGWPLDRLDPTLRGILRAGLYELLGRGDVPARVVIDEYVSVAHAFFGGKEPGMVNGVLDRLAHLLREEELQGGDESPS